MPKSRNKLAIKIPSRIGKQPIPIPKDVKVEIGENQVEVKGPKGSLSQEIRGGVVASIENNAVQLTLTRVEKNSKAYHGLYRALIANMVKGVTEGYTKTLELVGVGYRAENKGNVLLLNLGYSHPIYFVVPTELKVETVSKRGDKPKIILTGIDKQLIGHVAAELRSLRKPEPYKGKGVRFAGEVIKLKAGKTAAKKK